MLANDVVEMIGELAEEYGDADAGEILVALGVAPDEILRLGMVAGWSVERLERALVLMVIDGERAIPPSKIPWAAWLDGFTIGLALGQRRSSS
jgi:hypothetical protein